MTTTVGLERSYRRLTRLFPRPYRDAREDEMVSVLLEAAAPGQSRATVMESVDLLASAAKLWLLYAIGPNRSSRLATAGVLAVMLPATFLYGAGMSIRVITALPVGAVAGYIRHDQSWAAWLAWTAVTVLLLRRMSRSARAMALTATLLYLGSMSYTLWRLGPNSFVHSAAWFLAQVVSCSLLLSPHVVLRGYALVPRRWQLGVGLTAFALGFTHDRWWAVGQGAAALWVAAVVVLVLAAVLLRTTAGRAVVPVIGALIGFGVATRHWASNIRGYDHSGTAWLRVPDLLLLAAVPLLTLLALRVLTARLDSEQSSGAQMVE